MHACAHCEAAPGKLLRCASCKTVKYCGKECQVAAWKGHKKSCGMLASLRAAIAAAPPAPAPGPPLPERGHEWRLAERAVRVYDPAESFETAIALVDELLRRAAVGEYDGVMALRERALELAEAMPQQVEEDEGAASFVYHNMASIYGAVGDGCRGVGKTQDALAMYREANTAVDASRSFGCTTGPRAKVNFACALHSDGQHDEAVRLLQEILETFRDGEPAELLLAHDALAHCSERAGAFEHASELYQENADRARAAGCEDMVLKSFERLGVCTMRLGDFGAAVARFQRAQTMALRLAHPHVMLSCVLAKAHCMWSRIRAASGDARALRKLGEHLHEASDALNGSESTQHHILRFCMLSTVHARLCGDTVAARSSLCDMLHMLEMPVRDRCLHCGIRRGAESPLMSCGQCRVVYFCSEQCQSSASEGSETTNEHFVPRHSLVCRMLRTRRAMPAETSIEWTLSRPGLKLDAMMCAFIDSMTAGQGLHETTREAATAAILGGGAGSARAVAAITEDIAEIDRCLAGQL